MERKIIIDDTYMNVISFGNGKRNLAVIAGVSLTGLEGMGEAIESALSVYSTDFTVYVFDRKKLLPTGYTMNDMAEDIYICLKQLGIEQISVFGASQGGMIGQVLAINHPEIVENLIVCSTIARLTENNSSTIDKWLEAAKKHDVKQVNELFLEYVYSDAFIESIKDSIPEIINQGSDTDCDRFVIMLEAIKNFDIYDSLDKIQCPTLVIVDVNDNVFDYRSSYEIADKLQCDMISYDKYSHAVYDEAPDLKNRVIDFIKQNAV